MSSFPKMLKIGALDTLLAKAEVEELHSLINQHEKIEFTPTFYHSFLELIEAVEKGVCEIAILCAKSLKKEFFNPLQIAAITRSLDISDVLVLRQNETFEQLPTLPKIVGADPFKVNNLKKLHRKFQFETFNAPFLTLLDKLNRKVYDGVIADGAEILRLKLNHLNRLRLPGKTEQNQGRLAVLTRAQNTQIFELFSHIDSTKETIYGKKI